MLQFLFKQMSQDQKGQDLAEYALLIGLIALLTIIAVSLIGANIATLFEAIAIGVGI